MAAIDPTHPTARSFSAAYWRGGDEAVESVLFRPAFFDKVAVWGGDSAIRGALKYIGPGLELIAFDPKSSISIVSSEAFTDAASLVAAARAAGTDATVLNQNACSSSRTMYVQGTHEQVDAFATALLPELGVERQNNSAVGAVPDRQLRDEVEALRGLDEFYRVWGEFDGRGIVIRSDEPVEFYCDQRIVNVVPIESLADAVAGVTVATQTVGVYPAARQAELRDGLMSAGAQRVVTLGDAGTVERGMPHDGFRPLHRFMRWVNDEG
jgi:hypothetical protein